MFLNNAHLTGNYYISSPVPRSHPLAGRRVQFLACQSESLHVIISCDIGNSYNILNAHDTSRIIMLILDDFLLHTLYYIIMVYMYYKI